MPTTTPARGTYRIIVALSEPDGTLTQIRVEQRDYQYRLVSRAEFAPLRDGGPDVVLDRATALWLELLADARLPNPAPLSSEDRLHL